MTEVTHLLTVVDIDDAQDDGPKARRMWVDVRHEAVLADGRHVVLLDDRGWSASVGVVFTDGAPAPRDWRERLPSGWSGLTVEGLQEAARAVVGPDEPSDGETHAEMDASHWDAFADHLGQQGIAVGAAELKRLPHDVRLSERVLGRISRADSDAS